MLKYCLILIIFNLYDLFILSNYVFKMISLNYKRHERLYGFKLMIIISSFDRVIVYTVTFCLLFYAFKQSIFFFSNTFFVLLLEQPVSASNRSSLCLRTYQSVQLVSVKCNTIRKKVNGIYLLITINFHDKHKHIIFKYRPHIQLRR